MILQVVYCNHQSADLSVRERLAFPKERLARAYEALRGRFPHTEAVVLSTCNRIEVYTAQESPEAAPSHRQLAEFFSEFHGVPIDEFIEDFLERTGPDCVRHLFSVASSLDSMVLGEPQIVTQVKEAYRQAHAFDACGPLTNAMFQDALRVSGRVRTETKLVEGRVSIASVAVGEFGKFLDAGFYVMQGDAFALINGGKVDLGLHFFVVLDCLVRNRDPEVALGLHHGNPEITLEGHAATL